MTPDFSSLPPGGGAELPDFQQMLGQWQPPPLSFSLPQPGTVIPIPFSVSPKHLKEATEQVLNNLKRSAELIAQKIELWNLLEDLYYNNRELNQWGLSKRRVENLNIYKNLTKRSVEQDPADWRAHKCISPAPFVDQRVQTVTEAVFSNELYYRITPDAANAGETVEDPEFSTSRKMQAMLLKNLNELQFKGRTSEGLRDAGIFGTMAGKQPWYEDAEYEQVMEVGDDYQVREVEKKKIIRQGVVLDLLDLARFLPDPDAKSSDVQRWEFVGDRGPVAYNLIKGRFAQGRRKGPYNVNYREFLKTWPEGGEELTNLQPTGTKDDPDTQNIATKSSTTYLQVWEYHGKCYFSDRTHSTECVLTVVTSLNTDDPSSGIVVRFQERPVIKPGCRPYMVYHDIPQAGPLGIGIIEQNLDLIWLLSHCINMFIDAVRLVSVPMLKYLKGSSLGLELQAKTKGEVVYPGKAIACTNDLNEVEPFSLVVADLRSLIELIRYLEGMLEKRTAVSDASRGLSQHRKTATEVSSQMQAAQQPLQAALTLFKESFLDPFGRIALAHFQQKITEDQTIWMKGANGPTPQVLTLQEIQTGSYLVEATVDMPEHAKISRAQTIIQMMGTMEQHALPLLLLENKFYKRAGLVEALGRCIGINEETNFIETVDEQTKQMLLMMMQGGAPPPGPGQGSPQQEQPGTEQGQPIMPGPEMSQGSLPPEIQEMMARVQYDAQAQSPVPVGARYAA